MTVFHIVTLFPEMFGSYVNESILKRAAEDGLIDFKFYNPRDHTKNKHKQVDFKPYGGGPGMVIAAEPVIKAIEKARGRKKDVRVIYLSPAGKQFTNAYAEGLAKQAKHIIIVCGRYEGIDARVKDAVPGDEVSIGPYVLTGGELAAMVIADSVSRQVPGVLGNEGSIEESRVASPDVYTRPEVFKHKNRVHKVPKVLLSGNHAEIEKWRQGQKHR